MASRTVGLHLLAARQVLTAEAGALSDGGGLWLMVRAAGTSASGGRISAINAWVFRYTSPDGRRREMGLGVCYRDSLAQAGESLTAARDAAHKARELLREGVDPIMARDQAKQAADTLRAAELATKAQIARRQAQTLARVAREYHARVIEPSRTDKHAAQWITSLENHMPRSVWHAPIDSIEPPALLAALQAIKPHERARRHKGQSMPETVRRIRQRLDAVFEDAIFYKLCTSNPAAAVRRKLQEATGRRARGSFKALPYKEAPGFMARLRAAVGVSARCLELVVLTASRTSEALLAEWDEFDLDDGIWTIPGARMKAGEPHTVYLSPRALDVLAGMQGLHARWVFPQLRADDAPMSNMALLAVLDRMGERGRTTVHGLRATFSTWANETGAARPDVIEACLAHEEANKVRAAYNRSAFARERRELLAAWAEYLSRAPAEVVPIQSKRA